MNFIPTQWRHTLLCLLIIGNYPAHAVITIQATNSPVISTVTFAGNGGETPENTTVQCKRRDGGDPSKVTIDFYGEILCDGTDHIVNQGTTWPAHLTLRNYDTIDVILDTWLSHTGAAQSFHEVPTVRAVNECSSTFESSISLGNLVAGATKQQSLATGTSSKSGSLELKPSKVQGSEGVLSPNGDVLYVIPEATWDATKSVWTAPVGTSLTLIARVLSDATAGNKSGSLTATILCQ